MKKEEKSKLITLFSYLLMLFMGYGIVNSSFATTVHDPISYGEMLTQSLKQADQYSKQIEQYTTQLEQQKLAIQNATSLQDHLYIWSDASETISELLEMINSLSEHDQQPGDLEEYLSQFQDVTHYLASDCFSPEGCSNSEWIRLLENIPAGSEAQKEANDAMVQGLVLQQDNLQNDAQELEKLQNNATNAEGHMAAIQYANQLASSQTNQLMQIRGLLIAQHTAEVTRAQAIADREAQQEAASVQLRQGTYKDSPKRNWLGVMP
jgi:P-type conjugative transfer protein TrbJ